MIVLSRGEDELIRDVLLWIPTHGRAKAGRPARTYIQQLCEDTGCCPEDLPRAMNDRQEWRERVRDIRAASTIWWWWCMYYFPSLYVYFYHSFPSRVIISTSPWPKQFTIALFFKCWSLSWRKKHSASSLLCPESQGLPLRLVVANLCFGHF